MSNTFVLLPSPLQNGSGAATSVENLGPDKTVIVTGTFSAQVAVDISTDGGVTFVSAFSTMSATVKPLPLCATHMRVTLSNYNSGAPVVYVGAPTELVSDGVFAVPATNGAGAALDTSAFGLVRTVVVAGGEFSGALHVEGSDDGASWASIGYFSSSGHQTFQVTSAFMRVRRSGIGFNVNVPTVAVVGGGAGETPGQPPFSTTVHQIYARFDGSDTTGTGTFTNPYLTFVRAVRDVPTIIPAAERYEIIITDLGAPHGTPQVPETLPDDYQLPPWIGGMKDVFDFSDPFIPFRSCVSILAEPQLDSSVPAASATIDLATEVVPVTGIAFDPITGLTSIQLTPAAAAAKAWGVGAFKGKFFTTSGGGFESCVIHDNTADTLFVTSTFFFGGPTGPTFQIMEPSAILEGADNIPDFGGGALSLINIYIAMGGIGIRSSSGVDGGVYQSGGACFFWLCDLLLPAAFDPTRQVLLLSSNITGGAALGGPLYFTGSFFRGAFLELDGPHSSQFACQESVFEGLDVVVLDGALELTAVTQNWMWTSTVVRDSPGDAITVTGGNALFFACDVSNAGGNGISIIRPGYVKLEGVGSTVVNGGAAGALAQNGGQIEVDAATTIMAADAYKSGNNAAVAAWPGAAFNAPDFAGATATGSRIFEL